MTDPLVWIDREYDRSMSSRGSRYRAYLKARASQFDDATDAEHAATAWYIACSPIMSPGYVQLRPDIEAVHVDFDSDGRLVARLELRVQRMLPAAVGASLPKLSDWQRERGWVNNASSYPVHVAPDTTKDALLATYQLTVHLNEIDLGKPRGDRLDAVLAVRTVDQLADEINRVAGPIVAVLRGER